MISEMEEKQRREKEFEEQDSNMSYSFVDSSDED